MSLNKTYSIEEFIEEAKNIIRIDSVTQNGNEAIVQYLGDRMKELGMKVILQPVEHSLEGVSKRQFNLIGILGDPLVDKTTFKGLLLNTHLDTVGAGHLENWTFCEGNPFKAQIVDDKIYGLGSADVKLDFLCKLFAIAKLKDRKPKQPIYLVGTCGEELGMFGVKFLLQSQVLNPKYVVVGEPSELSLIIAHKSLNIFKVSLHFHATPKDAKGFNRCIKVKSFGKSAHGSYPDLGLNAILQLFEILQSSFEQGFEIKLTEIKGGDTINKVPDQAEATLYLASHQFEDFKLYLNRFIQSNQLEKRIQYEILSSDEAGVPFWPEEVYAATSLVIQKFLHLSYQLSKIKDPSYNPSHSTLNIGLCKPTLQGLDLFFDMRILPDQDSEQIKEEILKSIKEIAKEFSKITIHASRQRTNPGLGMKEEHELVRFCKDAMIASGLPDKLDKKATSTEASQYFKAGYPAVVIAPGKSHGNSHSPNEYNEISQLEKAIQFYERLIERICF